MGCCNQAPKGGTTQLGVLVKWVTMLGCGVLLLALVFG